MENLQVYIRICKTTEQPAGGQQVHLVHKPIFFRWSPWKTGYAREHMNT